MPESRRVDPIYALYNSALLLASPGLAVYLAHRLATGKSREGWEQRWGHLPEVLRKKTAPRLWVHAASVGEVVAATPILNEVRKRLPNHDLVMSTLTPGGFEMAAKQVGERDGRTFYLPFDLPWAMRRAVRAVQPDIFVDLETELWPNLLHHVKRAGARTILVNGRLSDRSIGTYRMMRPLFAWVLSRFDRVLVQTPLDAARFREIGAEPERLAVIGNSKFDQAIERLADVEVMELRSELRIPEGAPVLVVGSTRTAEEARMVIDAYVKARGALPDLVLIHAPRHVERAEELADIMRDAGLDPVRRTELAGRAQPVAQLILDSYGELAKVYALADVAFIGNSLVPSGAGQNLLQPLAQGKPVLYGPHMANFRDLVALAEEARVGFTVESGDDLAEQVISLIRDTAQRSEIAARAIDLVQKNRGASARYADAIAELAGKSDA